jgi:hypothetical protein
VRRPLAGRLQKQMRAGEGAVAMGHKKLRSPAKRAAARRENILADELEEVRRRQEQTQLTGCRLAAAQGTRPSFPRVDVKVSTEGRGQTGFPTK